MLTITPQRLTPGSFFEVEAELRYGTLASPNRLKLHGMVRLHVGNRRAPRLQNLTGDAFERVGVPDQGQLFMALSRGFRGGKHRIDWILAPPRSQLALLGPARVFEAKISIRLHAMGEQTLSFGKEQPEQLLIPIPEPGFSAQFLDYQLVTPPSNPRAAPSLNSDPAASVDAYR